MPPKKADPKGKDAPPVAVEEKELCLLLKFVDTSSQCLNNYRARIICSWLECCTLTETFGGPSLPWDPAPAEADGNPTIVETIPMERTVTLRFEYFSGISSNDSILNFNTNPNIYVVLFEQKESHKVPITFLTVDCSEYLLSPGKQSRRTEIIDGIFVELTVLFRKPILPSDASLTLDPLLVSFNRLTNYPCLNHPALNTFEAAFNKVYLYGLLDFGSFKRSIFARPFSDAVQTNNLDTTLGQTLSNTLAPNTLMAYFNVSTCILPGLFDLSICHERLMTTTFAVHIYDEDLRKRVFHSRNVDEYNSLLIASPRDETTGTTTAPAGKGKDAKAPAAKKGGASDVPQPYSAVESINAADRFLLKCISNALGTSSKIYTHGCIRFRLDPLLRSSEDLLTEFKRRRDGYTEEDNRVVVKDSVLAEVKLEKPSKPEKWSMPTDISIKKMLQNSRNEELSKLDGTLAAQPSSIAANSKPRYEMFFESGTSLKMRAMLIRKLSHPKPPASVVAASILPQPGPISPKKSPEKRRGSGELRNKSPPKATQAQESEERKLLLVDLALRLKQTPYTRMVFAFRYDDDTTLNKINDSVIKVNSRALPDIQGSLRSYSFSKTEATAAASGQLDVVTGFSIIDDDVRIVVCEGLAGPGQGMQALFVDIPRLKEDDKNLKILCNPEVLFSERLYTEFGPDIKRIRVRDKLKKLARKPELYNRKQVEELTFSAIDSVMSLRRAPDLQSTKQHSMYPTADALNNLELLYGEAISIADLDGTAAEALRKQKKASLIPVDMAEADPLAVKKSEVVDSADAESLRLKSLSLAEKRKAYEDRRCAPTDSTNPEYEKYLLHKNDPENKKDYLEESNILKRLAEESMREKRAELDKELAQTLTAAFGNDPSKCKVYMYSQQKLNYAEHAVEELRKSLAKAKDASFTYNKDFNSQTMSTVIQLSKPDPKGDWLTPSGFKYPKPKSTKELIGHPKKPSQARIEDLQEPYDNSFAPHVQQDPELLKLERGYSTRFRPECKDFLNLEEPVFAREFQLKHVGDKSKLPRGVLLQGENVNKEFFRSVHLGGDDALKILEEAIAKEKTDWQDKVVVDHNDFKIGGYKIRDKPVMIDRINDILKDEPKTKALIALRNMKSVAGRDISYGTTPIGLMTKEPYAPNAQKALLRTKDESKFVTMTDETRLLNRRPQDFTSYVNKDEYASKLTRAVAKRRHEPLTYRSPIHEEPHNYFAAEAMDEY